MAYYRINEIAKQLGCSPQAIYQKKDYLLKNGMAHIDKQDNLFKINENGLNYLMEKRKKYLIIKPNEMQKENEVAEPPKRETSIEVEYLERLIEEKDRTIAMLEKELEHFKTENKELILNQRLLFPKIEESIEKIPTDAEKQEKEPQQAETKKGLFSRLFG